MAPIRTRRPGTRGLLASASWIVASVLAQAVGGLAGGFVGAQLLGDGGWSDLAGAVAGIFVGAWVAAAVLVVHQSVRVGRRWWATTATVALLGPAQLLVVAGTTRIDVDAQWSVLTAWLLGAGVVWSSGRNRAAGGDGHPDPVGDQVGDLSR